MKNFRTLEDFVKATFIYERDRAIEVEYCEADCSTCRVEDCMYKT